MYTVLKPFDYLGSALAIGDSVPLSAPYAAFCIEAGLVSPLPVPAAQTDALPAQASQAAPKSKTSKKPQA